MDILLASGSPRRRDLLEKLGWDVRVEVPEVDESPFPLESPKDLCIRLASAKAAKVAAQHNEGDAIIIGADTIVVVDGDVLGKPADAGESLFMLKRLQGRTHEVLTGLCVIGKGKTLSGLELTKVTFRALDDEAVRADMASGEGADKAGAYAIQEKGSLLVASIEGDYFNVVGLPMCRLGLMLEELGLTLPLQWGEYK
jgi:septum formation protein